MSIPRLLRTVRFLKPGQVFARLRLPFKRLSTRLDEPFGLRAKTGGFELPVRAAETLVGPLQLRVLNREISIEGEASWNNSNTDKLLLYNLHYMDNLTSKNAVERAGWHRQLIERWMLDNPAPSGNGWEPYPLSLRIVNWIKWELAGNSLSAEAMRSLYLQAHVLSQQVEHHLLANHIFANAKALFFAGVFFDSPRATIWLQRATALLSREINEQVLEDGGHFELSAMYHAIVLEDILDIVNIGRAYNIDLPVRAEASIEPMLNWLKHMTHSVGTVARFNDATDGVAPSLEALICYAGRLGFRFSCDITEGTSQLADSGYVRYQSGSIAAIVDVGEIGPRYQPGHGHCDCLSFELSIDGRPYLVNTGVSTYNVNARRIYERSTRAHNTVSLASSEQSEIWSAFRVGERARPVAVVVDERSIEAMHDGYSSHGVLHRRRFEFADESVFIEDRLEGLENVEGTAHFHFWPDVLPRLDGMIVFTDGFSMKFENASRVELHRYEFSAGFNDTRPAYKLCATFRSFLTTLVRYEDSVH